VPAASSNCRFSFSDIEILSYQLEQLEDKFCPVGFGGIRP
jgi:hypothetical protein